MLCLSTHLLSVTLCQSRKPYFKKQKPSSAPPRNHKGRGAPSPARAKRGQQRTSTLETLLTLCQTLLQVVILITCSLLIIESVVCLCSHLLSVMLCKLENTILWNKNQARLRLATPNGDHSHITSFYIIFILCISYVIASPPAWAKRGQQCTSTLETLLTLCKTLFAICHSTDIYSLY